jgi:PBP4 family serine-type D-alanyl-D-alanine carboxypeptidase
MINRKQSYSLIYVLVWTLLGCGTTRPVISHSVASSPAISHSVASSPVISHSVTSPPVSSHSVISPPTPVQLLQNSINAILSDSIFISTIASIKVVSIDSADVLYEHESKALMNPASNIKLITSAAALSVLDTNYQYKTSVFVDNTIKEDDVVQNIYLKGYGDPNLTISDLDSLAVAVRQFGINTVKNIIVDDSFFDDNYWGAGWPWDDDTDPDGRYINAFSVIKNCIKINLIANSNTISISLEPNTDFVTVLNKAKIAFNGIHTPLKIRRLPLSNTNTIIVEGDMYRYSQMTRKIPLCRPEFYAGTLFKESLRHAGVSVSGNIVSGVVSGGMHEIAQHFQSIEKVVETMNKQSDNMSAENTLKVLGALKNGVPGSAIGGVFIEKRFLSDLGMDTTRFSIADGSGLSRYNLFSTDQLVRFLVAMTKQPRVFRMFYNSLSIAGVDGTIADRMSDYPAASNLRAKTGTLNGVSCLSGYVQTRDGEMLAFAMMMQNFISSTSNYCQAQDRIGSLLAGFSRTMIVQQGSIK